MVKAALLMSLLIVSASARIHRATLENDSRQHVPISTFGFLSGGTLAVNITSFKFDTPPGGQDTSTIFGFTLIKTRTAVNFPFVDEDLDTCILGEHWNWKHSDGSLTIYFYPTAKKLEFRREGQDLEWLVITAEPRAAFLTAHHLNRPDSHSHSLSHAPMEQGLNSSLSDHYLMSSRRKIGIPDDAARNKTPAVSSTASTDGSDTSVSESRDAWSSHSEAGRKAVRPVTELRVTEHGAYFLVYIQRVEEEGLYSLFFHNCLSYMDDASTQITMSLELTEDNNGNFLTAGEMPVPALYFTFCVLFFIAGIAWFSVLRKSQHDWNTIHSLMLVCVSLKGADSLLHGVNLHLVQVYGIREDVFAVSWYLVHMAQGLVTFVTLLLFGAGWPFIRRVLTCRLKMVLLISVLLRMVQSVGEVVVEYSEKSDVVCFLREESWEEMVFCVDIVCFLPVACLTVWTVRRLHKATFDENMIGNAGMKPLKRKVTQYKIFYVVMISCFYVTRIVTYLVKLGVPFHRQWLAPLLTELFTWIFFIIAGILFRPAVTGHSYVQLPQNDMELEADKTVDGLTKEEVVRQALQNIEDADDQTRQLESSKHVEESGRETPEEKH